MGIYSIDLYCVCWNEMRILPFVIQYWKRFVRHAYVYDNGSDDGTLEYLQQFDWITVRHFDSDGLDDTANMKIKNSAWNGSDADYVVVCDLDECLYTKDFNSLFSKIKDNNVSVVIPIWGEVCSIDFPKYNDDKLCHEICGGVYIRDDQWSHKAILFDPSQIINMNYGPGAHNSMPHGSGNIMNCSCDDGVYICHLKNIGIDYKIDRYKMLEKRRGKINRKYGFGTHYNTPEGEIRKEIENIISHNQLTVIE